MNYYSLSFLVLTRGEIKMYRPIYYGLNFDVNSILLYTLVMFAKFITITYFS